SSLSSSAKIRENMSSNKAAGHHATCCYIVSVPLREKGEGLNKMGFYRTALPTSIYLYRRKASFLPKNQQKRNASPSSRHFKKKSHKRTRQA
ncbi:MAG: hypothetical protein KHX13_08645, partial [Acidaminococcus intestini]|nr:hypothetical protein [Acidaminococcus intestini]